MRSLIPVFAIFLLVGCSDSPTSPSPTPPPTTTQPPPAPTPTPPPPVVPASLRWDRFGTGCAAQAAPNPIPTGGTLEAQDDGSVRGVWANYVAADGRDGLLTARFVRDDQVYVLCSWEMSDV